MFDNDSPAIHPGAIAALCRPPTYTPLDGEVGDAKHSLELVP
jgi:hypothetical protein